MNKKLIALAVAAGVGVSGVAVAATNGTIGATSTGTALVQVIIPSLIRISVATDVLFGTYGTDFAIGAGAVNQTGDACVSSNAGTYTITASSANPDGVGAFRMKNTLNADLVPYTVSWAGVALTENTSNNNGGAGFARDNLGPGLDACVPVAKISAGINTADLETVTAGTYEDTLTLVVAPI